MSKTRNKPTVPEGAGSGPVETVTTIEGVSIPAAELAHIAPHFRPFAVATSSLKLDPNNARKHDKRSIDSKASALETFGQQELLQFDPASRVVKVGNGRLAAATRILEWKWIAAVASNLSTEELRAFALSHNRTGETSEWDMEALARELDALSDAKANGELEELSLDEIGFGDDDMAEIEEGAANKAKAKQTSVDGKKSESVEGTTFQVVLSCNGEAHQTKILKAIEAKDVKGLLKLLTGTDVRARSV